MQAKYRVQAIYHLRMDSKASDGGGVVLLEMPEDVLIGLDFTVWKPDDVDCFCISGILNGPHFLSWERPEKGLKEGEMLWLRRRQVVVYKWDRGLELFLRVNDEDEVARYQSGHDDLSLLRKAVIYTSPTERTWHALTYAIVPPIIRLVQSERLLQHKRLREYDTRPADQHQPHGQGSQPVKNPVVGSDENDDTDGEDEFPYSENRAKTGSAPESCDERLVGLLAQGELDWTNVPPKDVKQASDPRLVSQSALNSSGRVATWIDWCYSRAKEAKMHPVDIHTWEMVADTCQLSPSQTLWLGELQLAYITFLLGANLGAFEHMKQYYLICPFADDLFQSRLGYHWMLNLTLQLQQTPDDFVKADITKGNFMIAAALESIEFANELEQAPGDVKSQTQALGDMVTKKFGMSILELTELQADRITVTDE
ncbi:AAR2 protein [Gregarina niphandrodes]|uniref:AAR2 protein n=1 Tax=Gregarina niphandrodes TaxID=110365 RepID=A0A023AZ07_GRENI|nr:AAR2 protein [Gregarina niphandrodes]EZG43723.1 AAR2 protein [Gregarina niphandrodes]|eukprot:XP_011133053.1 AAR2 protein [Gregarina niphandrodes]